MPKNIDRQRHHDVTIAEVLACTDFAHLSETEANEVVEVLKTFAEIACDFYEKAAKKGGNAI